MLDIFLARFASIFFRIFQEKLASKKSFFQAKKKGVCIIMKRT